MSNGPNLSSVADVISAGAIVGAMTHILPPLAAFIAIIWYLLEMYESKTMQGFLRSRKRRWYRRQRRILRHKKKPSTEAEGQVDTAQV